MDDQILFCMCYVIQGYIYCSLGEVWRWKENMGEIYRHIRASYLFRQAIFDNLFLKSELPYKCP
jgi:hypothetical protein